MDQTTRGLLQRATQDARRLLEAEFAAQLEGTFDILPDGTILPEPGAHLDDRQQLVRHKIVEAIEHIRLKEAGKTTALAVDDYLREAAFTFLNRFAALKMLEARGLVQQCVSKGDQSSGFKEFVGLAPGLGSLADKGYQLYLECLFDELGTEVKVLFDRRDPGSLLWPRRQGLLDLFAILNRDDLATVWGEDETIGWVYQYFNSQEERRAMRDASQAPRNSRELAVRNQFFTPRYVVQFLTDNTLGRIWYEMRRGETRLVEQCQYLVRRPTEIFLEAGQAAPSQETAEDLSQAELLQQPVHIPHRPKKDPRELKVLDPACGSGHFLLYCFELLLAIYEEAWHDEQSPPAKELAGENDDPPARTLREEYPTLEALHAATPELILRHNLHGIDIDGRCVQIAALALWMRAQRAWQAFGLAAADRPRVNVSRIVCAEPMPGEESLLQEFLDGSLAGTPEDRMLGQFVRRVFESMKLAGEAGSLLKIENEIAGAVAEAKEKWLARPRLKQRTLFAKEPQLVQRELDLEVARITDANFWDEAEGRIYTALRAYAELTEVGGGYQRRLFADDAARGFAFIDLCRNRYDVALMNPPFGDSTAVVSAYLDLKSNSFSNNLICPFVARGRGLAPEGAVGAITDSVWIKKADYEGFRDFLLAPSNGLQSLVDLGWGVLDGANVATCCFTSIPNLSDRNLLTTIRSVDVRLEKKESHINERIKEIREQGEAPHVDTFVRELSFFEKFPRKAIAYETPDVLVSAFLHWKPLEKEYAITRRGYSPGDTFRFFRCWWEIPLSERGRKWWTLNNGGPFAPIIGDGFYSALYEEDWASYRPLNGFRLESADWFGRAGLGWGKRTNCMYAYPLPAGSMFSNEGHCAFPTEERFVWPLVAYLNSSIGQTLLNLYCGQHKEAGYVAQLPTPNLDSVSLRHAGDLALQTWSEMSAALTRIETSENFHVAVRGSESPNKVATQFVELASWYEKQLREVDAAVAGAIDESPSLSHREFTLANRPKASFSKELPATAWMDETLSFAIGHAFGRWDIRLALDKTLIPQSLDPFTALPVCPPGLLQNEQGLPMTQEDEHRLQATASWQYPLDIPWNGILLDDSGHSLDIEARTQQVLRVIWAEHCEALEHEACETLGVTSMREYFRKPALFFADHLKRYSKSRRQAPIYWPLSSSDNGYTIWCYYHRFRRDTLSLALGDFAKPKLRHEQKQLDDLRADAGPQPTRSQREEIEAQESLVSELSSFVEELARVVPLWNPDLNDGVIINSAPLWRMIGHTPWRKNVKECWDTLCAGDYDWAHLAMHLWPERCVPKCADDRSLAIAHDLDNLLWVEDYGKWRKLLKPADETLDQKQRRQLPVYDRLREALQQLVAAPQGPTSAETLWQRLESGQLDESSLALILWPRRVVRQCINDRALAKTHGVQVPARLTEKSTEQLITRYENAGLPQSVSEVSAVFQRATPWANVWHELEQGACDQQPVALWLWPDRVIEKCLNDRDLCAQHELTRFFWYNDPVTGWRRRVAPAQEVTAEVTRRHNPTVKAALDSLLTAPPLTGAGGGRRGSRTATTQRVTRATASDAAPDDATPTRSRPRTSAPTTDIETLDMVKNVIAAVPNGASKTDVLTATGLSEARWTAAINSLLEQGTITRTGERRGTRYHFASENGQTNSSLAADTNKQDQS